MEDFQKAQLVGREFVKQYYSMLNKAPEIAASVVVLLIFLEFCRLVLAY